MTSIRAVPQFGSGDTFCDGRYTLGEPQRGSSGFSSVPAYDQTHGRHVSIVFVEPADLTPNAVRTLEREVEVAMSLDDCDQIMTVYETGTERGSPFLVRQRTSGETLRDMINDASQPLDSETCRRIVLAIARGLDGVHTSGLLHRDVRPENIVFGPDGDCFLSGLANAVSFEGDYRSPFMVTPSDYALPEALNGGPIDQRSDLYSLGVTLFEMLGQSPGTRANESEGSPAGLVTKASDDSRESHVASATEPSQLLAIAELLTNTDPDKRFVTASAAVSALNNVLPEAKLDIETMIQVGETSSVEFKASLMYSHGADVPAEHRFSKKALLEGTVLKTVAAFLNTQGGTLLVGVADGGGITGIERDFESFARKKNRDQWHLHLKDLMNSRISPSESTTAVEIQFHETLEGLTVAGLRVPRWSEPVWLSDGDEERFFTRVGPATHELRGRSISGFIRDQATRNSRRGW